MCHQSLTVCSASAAVFSLSYSSYTVMVRFLVSVMVTWKALPLFFVFIVFCVFMVFYLPI